MIIRLSDALSPEAVVLQSSWDGFGPTVRGLVGGLVRAERLAADLADEAVRTICEREQISSTAMVDIGVSIPHARLERLDGIIAAIAATEGGVYDHGHGLPISIVVLVLTSPSLTTEHLTFLSSLSGLLQPDRMRHSLETATSPADLLQLVRDYESS